MARWNDPAHLRRVVDRHRGQLAAIVFEPALCNTCCIEPVDGLMATIRELCDRDGMLMISDETITGFRFGAACAQGFYGYRPDLTILGKAVGGGTPFAALAGTKAAFAKILSGEVVHAGTLNGNPLCLAASKWSLDQVLALGGNHPANTQTLGARLMTGLVALGREHGNHVWRVNDALLQRRARQRLERDEHGEDARQTKKRRRRRGAHDDLRVRVCPEQSQLSCRRFPRHHVPGVRAIVEESP
jgi:glutamate-1-semialdehyde aminotransferase